MRGNPLHHQMIAPATLDEALALLAAEPGEWTPIAGGTELMVAYAAGRLKSKKLLSLWTLPELTAISITDGGQVSLGGGVTFAQIRSDPRLQQLFPLLVKAAAWIGSIANQSRATLAGNIANGSPAADAPPALLVYDAQIELISQAGKRSIPYADFHTGYKLNLLRPDEIINAILLQTPKKSTHDSLYKVGARKAMAITKVALAGRASLEAGKVVAIRLAAASLADRPLRLVQTENALRGKTLDDETCRRALLALDSEAAPIDDIRSTAAFRRQVAANLLTDFLVTLRSTGERL
uniref:Xanthine dehydrogenase, FAD-binding subunit n=1 Tax=mine drainage metagenome TaxID=410659 RepID=E6QJZ3_9ZZZZ